MSAHFSSICRHTSWIAISRKVCAVGQHSGSVYTQLQPRICIQIVVVITEFEHMLCGAKTVWSNYCRKLDQSLSSPALLCHCQADSAAVKVLQDIA